MGLSSLQRGDALKVIVAGEFGKLRPAIIIQSQLLNNIPSIIVVPCTSDLVESCIYRPDIPCTAETGLLLPSQAMADKIVAVSLRRAREVIGHVSPETLEDVIRSVQFVIGIFDP